MVERCFFQFQSSADIPLLEEPVLLAILVGFLRVHAEGPAAGPDAAEECAWDAMPPPQENMGIRDDKFRELIKVCMPQPVCRPR